MFGYKLKLENGVLIVDINNEVNCNNVGIIKFVKYVIYDIVVSFGIKVFML